MEAQLLLFICKTGCGFESILRRPIGSYNGVVVVVQLVDWSFSMPEIQGLSPVICNPYLLSTELKRRKRGLSYLEKTE